MKSAIIVGANGFIGQELTRYLLQRNIFVYALIQKGSDITFASPLLLKIPFEIEELNKIDIEFGLKPDLIYYMAWVGVAVDQRKDAELQEKNVTYTEEILRFAHRHGVKKVVFPGSAAQYGGVGEPITGVQQPSPTDAYSDAKNKALERAKIISKELNVGMIWTLISSVYSANRRDNNLISYTIESLLKGEIPRYTRLEQRWDYIHIQDLICALYLIGEKGIEGKVYPIGFGVSAPLSEYVEIIRQLINPEAELEIGVLPYKTGKVDHQMIDISTLQQDTGFEPQIDFQTGITQVIEQFREDLFKKTGC
ncbi:MAG: NAD-dependent epimerase/dehydratase family protein [Bacteroidales bacterium]|jgi:UDP-glucose 4-epimerase